MKTASVKPYKVEYLEFTGLKKNKFNKAFGPDGWTYNEVMGTLNVLNFIDDTFVTAVLGEFVIWDNYLDTFFVLSPTEFKERYSI